MSPVASAAVKLVARQPIFDRTQKVYGYELLFRPDPDLNACPEAGSDATMELIGDTLMLHDLDTLANKLRAFVNMPRASLLAGHAQLLPKTSTVLEILETVEPDAAVMCTLGALRRAGYTLALDDVSDRDRLTAFAGVVHMAKIDLTLTTDIKQQSLLPVLRRHGMTALAEKVETKAQFRAALATGFQLFQGYFFARPEVVEHHDFPAATAHHLRLLQIVQESPLDIDALESVIQQEPAFAYKLLRYLNSPQFALRHTIHSIRHAISLLGENEVRRWASMMALSLMASGQPPEIVLTSLRRAVMCEQLAGSGAVQQEPGKLFLAGLFSTLDAILDRPRAEVVGQLPLDRELEQALLGTGSILGTTLALVEAYDQADWSRVQQSAGALRLEDGQLLSAYRAGLQRSQDILSIC